MEEFRQLLIALTVFLAFGFSWSVLRIHRTSLIGVVGGAGILALVAAQLFQGNFGILFASGVFAISFAMYILSISLARAIDVLNDHKLDTGKDQAVVDLAAHVLGKR